MVYFDQILPTYTCTYQHCLNTGTRELCLASVKPVVVSLITLEPHGIFTSIFACLSIYKWSASGMQNNDEAAEGI